jgi:hypothetical protein
MAVEVAFEKNLGARGPGALQESVRTSYAWIESQSGACTHIAGLARGDMAGAGLMRTVIQ